jgi:hypothetical protein
LIRQYLSQAAIEAVNNFYMLEKDKCVTVNKTNRIIFLQKQKYDQKEEN